MLPSRKALIGVLARSGVIGSNVLSAVECPLASSALPDIESSGVRVYAGVFRPRLAARYYGLPPSRSALRRDRLLTRVSSKTTAKTNVVDGLPPVGYPFFDLGVARKGEDGPELASGGSYVMYP